MGSQTVGHVPADLRLVAASSDLFYWGKENCFNKAADRYVGNQQI